MMTFFLSFTSILIVIIFHYWSISALTSVMPDNRGHNHFLRSILLLSLLYVVHLLEISWFALGFYIIDFHLGTGEFSGTKNPGLHDYVYFSTVSYSTLGLSSLKPQGALKLFTAVVSLSGFIMLTWSATFFYNLTSRRSDS